MDHTRPPVPMSPCQMGPAVNHRPYERALLSMDHAQVNTGRGVIRRDDIVMLKSRTRAFDQLNSFEGERRRPAKWPIGEPRSVVTA